MKSKEEIEQLADFKYQHFTNEATQNHFKLGFYDGYTQCQEDMADKIKEAYEQGLKEGYACMPSINSLNKQDNEK